MEVFSITKDAIAQAILPELKNQLMAQFPAVANATSAAEFQKLALAAAQGAAQGVFQKVVTPVIADVKTITDAIKALQDTVESLQDQIDALS